LFVNGSVYVTNAPQFIRTVESCTGRTVGLDVGIVVGLKFGFDVGFDVGFEVGFDVGFDVGFEVGFDVGFDVGFEVGFDVGGGIGSTISIADSVALLIVAEVFNVKNPSRTLTRNVLFIGLIIPPLALKTSKLLIIGFPSADTENMRLPLTVKNVSTKCNVILYVP
jgi:hypothetical protein